MAKGICSSKSRCVLDDSLFNLSWFFESHPIFWFQIGAQDILRQLFWIWTAGLKAFCFASYRSELCFLYWKHCMLFCMIQLQSEYSLMWQWLTCCGVCETDQTDSQLCVKPIADQTSDFHALKGKSNWWENRKKKHMTETNTSNQNRNKHNWIIKTNLFKEYH